MHLNFYLNLEIGIVPYLHFGFNLGFLLDPDQDIDFDIDLDFNIALYIEFKGVKNLDVLEGLVEALENVGGS